jgi:hypothetical protein
MKRLLLSLRSVKNINSRCNILIKSYSRFFRKKPSELMIHLLIKSVYRLIDK